MNKTIIIAGGSGLVGTHLARHLLQREYEVVILSRNPERLKAAEPGIRYAKWDVERKQIDADVFSKAHAVVNLAGAGVVAKPWTEAYRKEIVESRVSSGQTIVQALQSIPNNIETVVSASAIGFYGADQPGHIFTEADIPDENFLGEACRQWEASVDGVEAAGKRLVVLRIGIVLAPNGGALAEFVKPLRFRVAAVLGNGQQMISWVHIDDLCRMMIFAIENSRLSGVYNAVAPMPVTNAQLTHALAKAMYGKAYIAMPVPSFVLKIMMGERSIEVLKSTTVSSAKLAAAGFPFRYPGVDSAMQNLANEI
jgi:hypothetical protein